MQRPSEKRKRDFGRSEPVFSDGLIFHCSNRHINRRANPQPRAWLRHILPDGRGRLKK
ncbi:hypothetical protein [Kingella potus]|uniref:hypothetical protein n=1 Tax=Kingella potus TaxID=265175 RepID=UPI001FD2C593|nr:hypothetical protein [Kingella potus]UOP00803.1 hypothetical protein LVJ84_13805 [Kingella potus]